MKRKKVYIAPKLFILAPVHDSLLYETSVPGGKPDEGQPEAKQGLFEEEALNDYSMPIQKNLWADEEEEQ